MRTLLISIFIFIVAMPVSAQSDKPRNWFQISTMKTNGKYDKKHARIFTQKGLPHWKEISLKTYDSTRLNKIELALLDRYTDVVVTKMHKAYFIFNNDSIGIASITGEEIVPPVAGKIRFIENVCIVGDLTSDFDTITDYTQRASQNSTYKIAYSCGLSKCILKLSVQGMQVIIPYGKYDFISVVPKGLGIRGFYVCKIDDQCNTFWGVCDNNGQEIIACKYKSIYFNGQFFVGDNNHSMEDLQYLYAKKIQIQQDLTQRRRQQWAAALNTLGQTAVMVGQSMQDAGIDSSGATVADANVPSNNSTASNSSSKSSPKSNTRHNISEIQAKNTDSHTYSSDESLLIKMHTYWETQYNDNERRNIQRRMKQIRTKWVDKGYQFYHSPWEDWDGKIK